MQVVKVAMQFVIPHPLLPGFALAFLTADPARTTAVADTARGGGPPAEPARGSAVADPAPGDV